MAPIVGELESKIQNHEISPKEGTALLETRESLSEAAQQFRYSVNRFVHIVLRFQQDSGSKIYL